MTKKHNNIFTRISQRLRDDNEKGSRQALLEELFNDFNRNRYEIYKINFFRGIFFRFRVAFRRYYSDCVVGLGA